MSLKSRLRAVLSRVREFFLSLFPFISPLPSNAGFLYTPSIRFRVAFGVSSSSSSSSRLLNKSTGGQRSRVEPDRRRGTPQIAAPLPTVHKCRCPFPLSLAAIIQFQKWREGRRDEREGAVSAADHSLTLLPPIDLMRFRPLQLLFC